MKTILFTLLSIICFNVYSNAQSYRNDASKKYAASSRSKNKYKEKVYENNVIKLNLTGLLFKSVGLQYEHKFKKKVSFAAGLIYRPKGSWIGSNLADSIAANSTISKESKFMLETSKYRTFMFTPELRYYLSRKAPRGLYIAAFARAKFDKMSFNYHYYDDVNFKQETAAADLKERYLGAGVMLGLQLITSKKISIDFWFLGPWVSSYHANLSSKVNVNNIQNLQKTFIGQDMNFWFRNENEIKWNNSGISTIFNDFSVSARFVGINIGYNF